MSNRFENISDDWEKKPSRVKIAQTCSDNIKEVIKFKKAFKILDYGCGTGQISFNLYDKKYDITGMDNSNTMVEKYNQKVKDLKYKNIKAIKHDISLENLPKNQYDLLVISMTLHHIEDINMFVKKAKHTLNDGGYLCINDLVSEDGSFHSEYNNEGIFHFGFDEEDLSKIVLSHGFELIEYKIVHTDNRNNKKYPIFQLIAKAL